MNEVTNIEQLKEYAQGALVELPPFGEGQPFVARLRRPSMLVLMKSGKIPNALLDSAKKLFDGSTQETDEVDYTDILGVLEVIAEASFISPTWEELKTAGIELTDEQYISVFNYSQRGVVALNSFRTK